MKVAVAVDDAKADIWMNAIKARGWSVESPQRLSDGVLVMSVSIDESQLIEMKNLLRRLQAEWEESEKRKLKKKRKKR